MIELPGGIWDAALLLIDYQENVLAEIAEPARAIVERNVCMIAAAAHEAGIPVVVSTLGVEIGLNPGRFRRFLRRCQVWSQSIGPA